MKVAIIVEALAEYQGGGDVIKMRVGLCPCCVTFIEHPSFSIQYVEGKGEPRLLPRWNGTRQQFTLKSHGLRVFHFRIDLTTPEPRWVQARVSRNRHGFCLTGTFRTFLINAVTTSESRVAQFVFHGRNGGRQAALVS